MDELVCPHCASHTFNKNPYFLECAECGTRYVRDPDGSLRRTDAFGQGQGTGSWSSSDVNTAAGGGYGGASSNRNGYGPNTAPHHNGPYAPYAPYSPSTGHANYDGSVRPSPKSKVAALLLCIFLGFFGAHYFYVRRPWMGILYLFTLGLFGYGWLFCIVWIALGKFKDSEERLLVN